MIQPGTHTCLPARSPPITERRYQLYEPRHQMYFARSHSCNQTSVARRKVKPWKQTAKPSVFDTSCVCANGLATAKPSLARLPFVAILTGKIAQVNNRTQEKKLEPRQQRPTANASDTSWASAAAAFWIEAVQKRTTNKKVPTRGIISRTRILLLNTPQSNLYE